MDALPLISRRARLWKDKADFFRPFRSAANDGTTQASIRPLFDPDLAQGHPDEDADIGELNNALQTLVEVFPNIEPEVFRDILSNLSPESRVEVVAEHIMRRNIKDTFTRRKGRDARDAKNDNTRSSGSLQDEERFRGEQYHNAVKALFYQEFRSLGHSTIKGVLAENNGSYTRSRPILQYLSSRTWRSSLASFWNRGSTVEDATNHPAISWQAMGDGQLSQPFVRSSGSTQLDREIYELFVQPIITRRTRQQLISDQAFAINLNEAEAVENSATYDCECCYSTVAFEQILSCSAGDHFLCYDCVRRTTTEAVYGQGWARNADLERNTIRCFAPALQECPASLPTDVVQRALQQDPDNPELWPEFCKRITNDVLLKSRLSLQHCPSCDYAEADELPKARLRTLVQFRSHVERIVQSHVDSDPVTTVASTVSPLLFMLLAGVMLVGWALSYLSGIALLIRSPSQRTLAIRPISLSGPLVKPIASSLSRIHKERRGLKFKCQKPGCMTVSCVCCHVQWKDPHVCFDDEKTSLRTAIEASATAAIKRTCPRCLLSFVKASGCNKLVCNCGYTMCYVCRSEITSREGYTHFCQHFRPMGGNCIECDRCDLYGDEDEKTAIRAAEAMAEREWRDREAKKSQTQVDGSTNIRTVATMDVILGQDKRLLWPIRVLEGMIDAMVVFEDD